MAAGGGHFHALLVMPGITAVFAGTHIGLFRSDDFGLTCRLAAPRLSGDDVHAIARDPQTGALYVATHGQGLLVSHDGGGVSWGDDSAGLPDHDLHALALDPGRDGVYVWVVGHGLFYRAPDARRWQPLAGLDRLELDVQERDRYGRLLVYVYAGEQMVNAELVRRVFAQVMTVPPNVRHQALFMELQREARERGCGLWASPAPPRAARGERIPCGIV